MDLTLLKQHLRIDGTEEDDLLESYVEAASLLLRRETGKNYVLSDGSYVDIESDGLFQQAEKMLVAHWYENRQPIVTAAEEIPFAVTHLASQIALGGAYYAENEAPDVPPAEPDGTTEGTEGTP